MAISRDLKRRILDQEGEAGETRMVMGYFWEADRTGSAPTFRVLR